MIVAMRVFHLAPSGPRITALVFHLPGKHDQQTHGRGGDRSHDAVRAEFNGWSTGLSERESGSLKSYQGFGFQIINTKLRGKGDPSLVKMVNTPGGAAAVDEYVTHIDSAIAKGALVEATTLYRGMDFDADPATLVGSVLRDDGYASTSITRSVSEKFVGKAKGPHPGLLRITTSAGQRAAYLDALDDVPPEGLQHEILLPRGTSYKVTGYNDGVLEAEIVGD